MLVLDIQAASNKVCMSSKFHFQIERIHMKVAETLRPFSLLVPSFLVYSQDLHKSFLSSKSSVIQETKQIDSAEPLEACQFHPILLHLCLRCKLDSLPLLQARREQNSLFDNAKYLLLSNPYLLSMIAVDEFLLYISKDW